MCENVSILKYGMMIHINIHILGMGLKPPTTDMCVVLSTGAGWDIGINPASLAYRESNMAGRSRNRQSMEVSSWENSRITKYYKCIPNVSDVFFSISMFDGYTRGYYSCPTLGWDPRFPTDSWPLLVAAWNRSLRPKTTRRCRTNHSTDWHLHCPFSIPIFLG